MADSMARERMSLKRFIDRYITAGSEQKLSCEVQVDGAQAKLGEPVPVIVTGTVNSGGTITGVSATGTVPVTEASAVANAASNASTASYTLNTSSTNMATVPPQVGGWGSYASVAEAQLRTRRKKVVPIATDGGGAAAATELVGTNAGYYPVIDSILVECATADATTTLTFSASAGALLGQAANVIALVASTINTQLKDGLWYSLTDGATLSVAIAGGPATETVHVQVEYHYET